jgi:phosphoribosylamine--glycine ligase
MATGDGVKVIEFNARFGDPEAEVVLPMLDNDLLDVLEACSDGGLDRMPIRWEGGSCVTVVMAAAGYPGDPQKGDIIYGLDSVPPGVTIFHCGTATDALGNITAAGGRILSVTARAADLRNAVDLAYKGVQAIHFEGCQFRRDIAHRAL